MTPELDALYQRVVLEHARHPRNRRAIAGARRAEGRNPVCGDRLTVYVRIEHGVVEDAAFEGYACAIATASASMMIEAIAHRPAADAQRIASRFEAALAAGTDAPMDDLGPLAALAGVRRFPTRARCALLPWKAFRAAAAGGVDVVSTEGVQGER